MRIWTFRTRLTVVYGCLVLLAGTALLGVTYLLVQHSVASPAETSSVTTERPPSGSAEPRTAPPTPPDLDAFRTEVRKDTLRSLVTQGGIALAGVGLTAIVICWLMAERVLRPVHRITETARRVADRSLHERIALAGPNDEIKELADTFDSMLERLDRAFDGQRRFVGNASHELRTPLAINRTLLEVALRRPDAPQQLRDLGMTLLEVNTRQELLIDGLLTLARSEQGVTVDDPVDLAELAHHVIERSDPGPVEVRAHLSAAPTRGDVVLLERVVENLVQNATAYNIEGGWLSVATSTRAGSVELVVSNTGPVVPAHELPGLFEPFRRLGAPNAPSPSSGSGLGLSIVRSVARAHGGDATARPRDGGGLLVTVTLPAAPLRATTVVGEGNGRPERERLLQA